MTEDTVSSSPDTQYHEVTLAEVLGMYRRARACAEKTGQPDAMVQATYGKARLVAANGSRIDGLVYTRKLIDHVWTETGSGVEFRMYCPPNPTIEDARDYEEQLRSGCRAALEKLPPGDPHEGALLAMIGETDA